MTNAERTKAELEASKRVAINRAIASSNRSGRKINGREAKLIHAILKGRS